MKAAMLLLLATGGFAHAAPVQALLAQPGRTATFSHFVYQGQTEERVAPGRDDYRNPILSGYYPDPSVARVGADYYLVNSSFAHFPGLPIFHSRDLVSWTQIGNAISRPGQLDFAGLSVSRGAFAPDISFHDGLFYIVNTCVGCGGNYVITARDPAGPWSDPTWLPFDGIDPSIFWDGDRAWIVNNGPPDEAPRYEGHRAIWVQQFDWRALKLSGARTQIVNGGTDIAKRPVWIEGPHLFRRGAYVYLIAAEGGTADQHSEVVFRASGPTGPFTPFAGNPILTQRDLPATRADAVSSAGHADFVTTPAGDWWATFLAVRPYAPDLYNSGRETFLLPVTWSQDWPVILPHGQRIPFAAKRPMLPPDPVPAVPLAGDVTYRDEFEGGRLGLQWIGIRGSSDAFATVADHHLRLQPAGRLGDLRSVPGFVGRRQQTAVATVSIDLDDRPQQAGDRAGLAAVQNDEAYLFFGLVRREGRVEVVLIVRPKDSGERVVAAAPLAGRHVTLSLHLNGGRASAIFIVGGRSRTLATDVDANFLSTQKAGGFVGTIIGPYAAGR